MAHSHEVLDDDLLFEIDDETREIKRLSENELILVQGDHNSERCTFKIPKLIDGHNTELCNKVRIHFMNIAADNPLETNPGVWETEDLRVMPGDPQYMTVSWCIEREATMFVGSLSFLIEFMCISAGEILDYSWHTGIYTGGIIAEGMDNSDAIIGKHYDVLDKWVATIEAEGNRVRTDVLARIDAAAKTAETNAKQVITDHTETVKQDLTIHGLSVKDVLVHETGTNKNKIMSQFGVNTEVAKLDSKIAGERSARETAFTQLSDVVNARLAGASLYTKLPLEEPDCNYCIIEIGNKYMIKSNKTASSWGFHISFFATVTTEIDSDGEWFTPADISFDLPTVDQYATTHNELRILSIIPETDTYGADDPGIKFKVVLEINGARSECYTDVFPHSDRQGTSYTLLDSTIMLYDDTVITYLINDDPTAKTAVNINANGIASVYLHSYEIVDDYFVSTYRIMYTNGDHFDFSVKDGVKINNIALSEYLDYTDSYVIECSNGDQFFFEVPNSNTVGIETSDSGYSIHAKDLIPLEHTIRTKVRSKNMIVHPYSDNHASKDGITYTIGDDYSITINGTAEHNTSFNVSYHHNKTIKIIKGKTYTFSCTSALTSSRGYIFIQIYQNGTVVQNKSVRNNDVSTFTATHDGYASIGIVLLSGITYSNETIRIQLEEGNTVTPYIPYVNPNEVTLRTCGKNLIKYPHAATSQTVEGVEYTDNGDGTVTVNGTASVSSNSIHYLAQTQASNIHLGPGTYTLSGCPAGGSNGTYRLTIKTNDASPEYYHDFGDSCTFTLDTEKIIYIYICIGQGASADNLLFKPQLEFGDTATEFEEYEGDTYIVAGDGVPVYPVRSIPRLTSILSDKMGVILDVIYNRDNTILTNRLLEQYEANEARFNSKANVTYVDSEIDSVVNKLSEVDSQHNKRITNLEHLIDPEITHTDDAIAHVKDVPAGAISYAEVTKIGGMTRKCTNLIPFTYKSETVNGITFTVNDDGTVTANGTATADATFYAGSFTILANKTYQYTGCPTGGSESTYYVRASGFGNDYGRGISISCPYDFDSAQIITIKSGYTANNLLFKPMVNEGETALPYEPYFEGLRSAPVSELVSEGVNVWDEEWYNASLNENTGAFTEASTADVSSKNYISVLPNTQYYKSVECWIAFYDKNKAFISASSFSVGGFTTPSNCYFMKFQTLVGKYGLVYKNDIIIAKGSTALPYRPYFKRTLPIPEAVRPAHGINENVYDYIEWCEDGTRKKHIKCGVADMADLTWNHSGDYWYTRDVASIILVNWRAPDVLADNYNTHGWEGKTNGDITMNGDGYICVVDDVANRPTGKLLYALATPEVTDISDILTDDNFIEVEGGGSITAVNEFGYDVPTEITYMVKEGDAT